MTMNKAMPTFVYVWPVECSEMSLDARSVPPTMQRMRAIRVGNWAIWMMRLRRETAVARLVMMFPTRLWDTKPAIAVLP